jgi:hypothetical protein
VTWVMNGRTSVSDMGGEREDEHQCAGGKRPAQKQPGLSRIISRAPRHSLFPGFAENEKRKSREMKIKTQDTSPSLGEHVESQNGFRMWRGCPDGIWNQVGT